MREQNRSPAGKRGRAHVIARTAILLALMITLAALENTLPPIPFAPPGVKLGLSNIVTMYALFTSGSRRALALAVLKSIFVMLTRGITAGVLSLCGGAVSVLVIALILAVFKEKVTRFILSVSGAITHNFAQTAAASVMMSTGLLWVYWPILMVAGILTGLATGTLLRLTAPYIEKFFEDR